MGDCKLGQSVARLKQTLRCSSRLLPSLLLSKSTVKTRTLEKIKMKTRQLDLRLSKLGINRRSCSKLHTKRLKRLSSLAQMRTPQTKKRV